MLLKDRVALVTGASRGIGASTAELLADRGARVALGARTVPDLEDLENRIKEIRRLAQPEEVATVIAFLASDDASYVNGACIDINGGSYMA